MTKYLVFWLIILANCSNILVGITKINRSLIRATAACDIPKIHALKARGANLHIKNNDEMTLLHCAVSLRSLELVKYFIAQGIDINAQDNSGKTALMQSIANIWYTPDCLDIATYLLSCGARVDVQDEDGKTALIQAFQRLDARSARLLLSHGADLGAVDKSGRSARFYAQAASAGYPEIRLLIREYSPSRCMYLMQ